MEFDLERVIGRMVGYLIILFLIIWFAHRADKKAAQARQKYEEHMRTKKKKLTKKKSTKKKR